MEASSPGKLLPQIVLPYAQQWAERSGLDVLSRLLADSQFRDLLERYSEELYVNLTPAPKQLGTGNGSAVRHDNGYAGQSPRRRHRHNGASHQGLDDLVARVSAVEAQHEALQKTLEGLRLKLTPLALALGCCPECLVGLEGCATCAGEGTVGHYPADVTLLEREVFGPLSAQGLRLQVRRSSPAPAGNSSNELPKRKRRRS